MAALTDAAAKQALVKVRQEELSRNVAREESANLKNSLLFQYNWPDLLQSAPTAINSMGSCFVAASSPTAQVFLDPPAKGFQYLRYTSLQANLVEAGNLGRYAFNEAEIGMGQISQASDIIYGKLRDVMQLIGDPESARVMLKPQLNSVLKSAQTSAASANKIEEKFHQWLFYVCELHAACTQQQQTAADTIKSNEICIAAEQTKLDRTQDAVATAKQATDLLGKQVQVTSDAFKKASDSMPSGWDIVGQQIVGELAGAATTALKACIPALVSSINPVQGVISQGQNIVGSFVNKGSVGPADGTTNVNGSNRNLGSKSSPSDGSALTPQSKVDPAAAALLKDMTYIEVLNTIMSGPDGGIDWEKARGASDAKSSIAFVSSMLEEAKKTFAGIKSDAPSSAKVATILETTSQVASGVMAVVEKSKNVASSWPARDSPEVLKWSSSFKPQYLAAVQVAAVAAANNGGPTSSTIVSDKDPSDISQMNQNDTQGQTVMKTATNTYNMAQKAYLATQDNYLKAATLLTEQQNKIAEISATLTKLSKTNVTLDEIKKVLIESIKLIIQLKSQINNLVQFFSAMTVIVSTVVTLHVEPFIDTIKRITSGGGEDPNANWQVGKYTLTDYMRTNMFTSVLTLRTYFSVFGDVAKMWMRLSIECIQPGVKLCDEISVTGKDNKQLSDRMQRLSQWSAGASKTVQDLVGQTQKQIVDGMDERVTTASSTIQLLPPSPVQAQIEAGKDSQTREVAAALTTKQEGSAMFNSRFID